MLACEIRTATSGDMPHVAAIYSHFVRGSTAAFDVTGPGVAEMLRRRQAVLDRGLLAGAVLLQIKTCSGASGNLMLCR